MDLQEGNLTFSRVVSGKAGWPESSEAPNPTAIISNTFLSYPHREETGVGAESHPKPQTEWTSVYI